MGAGAYLAPQSAAFRTGCDMPSHAGLGEQTVNCSGGDLDDLDLNASHSSARGLTGLV